MPIKYLDLVQRINVGIYSLTSFLVVFLGLFILVPMFTSNPYEENDFEMTERAPAGIVSLHKDLEALATQDQEMATLDLECIKEGGLKPIKSQAKQIRLIGHWCGSTVDRLQEASVLNRANGYQATMFKLKHGSFTSDYISLVKGKNRILLQVQADEKHKSLTELTILRE